MEHQFFVSLNLIRILKVYIIHFTCALILRWFTEFKLFTILNNYNQQMFTCTKLILADTYSVYTSTLFNILLPRIMMVFFFNSYGPSKGLWYWAVTVMLRRSRHWLKLDNHVHVTLQDELQLILSHAVQQSTLLQVNAFSPLPGTCFS